MLVASEELSDDRLLNDYVVSHSQEAFAELVRRYGPMVWGVCRRVAGHAHDAEDAFQATFAVLARKARSIRRRRSIGAWLHQVARRNALRARAISSRGGTAMVAVVTDLEARPADDEATADRSEMLDDEIVRLPESLRLPIVLCYLQGLTNREAGQRLGCPEGTIVSRLARARDLLRQRLVRRGFVLGSSAAVATLLIEAGFAAPLAPALIQSAVKCGLLYATTGAVTGTILSAGAARLAEETIGWMSRRVLLLWLGMLLGSVSALALIAFGARAIVGHSEPKGGVVDGTGLDLAGAGEAGLNLNAAATPLDGVWEGEDLEFVGGADAAEHAQNSRQARWVVSAGNIQFKWQDRHLLTARFVLDPANISGQIDCTVVAGPEDLLSAAVPGLYQIRDRTLETCCGPAGGVRPPGIKPGIVAAPADESVVISAGLAGYSRLRRLNRSLEAEELQGKWLLVSWQAGGAAVPVDPQGRQAVEFHDDRYVLHFVNDGDVVQAGGQYALDPARPAQFLELRPTAGDPMLCLYEIEGDKLRLSMAAPGAARPNGFKTAPGSPEMSMDLKRQHPSITTSAKEKKPKLGNPPGNSGNESEGTNRSKDPPP